MGKVVHLPVVTRLDSDPNHILEWAGEEDLESVLVVGFRNDGSEYFASSIADGGTCIWLIERAKKKLLEMPDEYDG